jgi:hypothetical protein
MSLDLLVWGALTGASGFAAARAVSRVPLPAKWPWGLGLGLVFVYCLAAALYEWGGRFVALLPAFWPLKAAIHTTGSLALAVGAYSAVQGPDKISAQWFALPTGSAPLSMVYQYVSPHYISAVFLGAALAFCFSRQSPFVAPLAAALAAVVAGDFVGAAVPGLLTVDQLQFSLLAAAAVAFSVLATGGKLKTK